MPSNFSYWQVAPSSPSFFGCLNQVSLNSSTNPRRPRSSRSAAVTPVSSAGSGTHMRTPQNPRARAHLQSQTVHPSCPHARRGVAHSLVASGRQPCFRHRRVTACYNPAERQSPSLRGVFTAGHLPLENGACLLTLPEGEGLWEPGSSAAEEVRGGSAFVPGLMVPIQMPELAPLSLLLLFAGVPTGFCTRSYFLPGLPCLSV